MKEVLLHTSDASPGGENYRYWVAPNGIWLVKENDLWKAVVPADAEAELALEPMTPELTLKGFYLPLQLVMSAVEFFRHVFRRYKAEAFLWITQDSTTGELGLACPRQTNRHAHVHAHADDCVPPGARNVGTMHSHPCSAFHSDGDIADEARSDGVHIVVGHLERPQPEFAAVLAVRGERRVLDPAEIMDLGFGFDDSWLDRIDPPSPSRGLRRFVGGTD